MIESLPRRISGWAVGLATALTIVGLAVALFLNPVWVTFEQGRSGADRLTGYTPQELAIARDRILSDLVFGPPRFDVQLRGQAVLDDRERAHLADVRAVFIGFGAAALAAIIVLAVAGLASRGAAWFWRAVARGATALIGVIAVAGVVIAVAFDAAFELFHELFFAGGSYTFDPAHERLVQLFPDQFWSETSIAVGVVIIGIALLVRRFSAPRALEARATTAGSQAAARETFRDAARDHAQQRLRP